MQSVKNRILILAIGVGVGLALRAIFFVPEDEPAGGASDSGSGVESRTEGSPGKAKPPVEDAASIDPLVPPIRLDGAPAGHASPGSHRRASIDARDQLAWLTAGSFAGEERPKHAVLQAALGAGREFKFNQLTHNPLDHPLPRHAPGLAEHAGGAAHATAHHDAGHHGAQRISTGDFAHGDRAVFEPHGEQVCASGCAASRHPTTPLVTNEFHELLREFGRQPMSEDSPAFEKLLYYGKQTQQRLQRYGCGSLDPLREQVLKRELKKTHASVQIRLVDEHGEIRSWLPATPVPLDRRHVFDMEAKGVQPLVTSGTVKRVGLYHLWTRL